jgi:uncharacterized protein YecE (DUF72 family)
LDDIGFAQAISDFCARARSLRGTPWQRSDDFGVEMIPNVAAVDVNLTVPNGPMVCEPRHATWFSSAVASLLDRYRISRVAADPPPVPEATVPTGWPRLVYFRLHGSPRKYRSRYDEHGIATLAATVRSAATAAEVWCMFDNTASGAAIENAWELRERLIVDSSLG